MTSKQNLFLFFEDSDIDHNINSKLVQLSMNRFIVEEDAQVEISGIYHFKMARKSILDKSNPLFKTYAKQRIEKEAFDKDLLSDALEKVMNRQESFLFGHFRNNILKDSNRLYKPPLVNERSFHNVQPIS